MTGARLRQLATSRPFIMAATGVVISALAQAGIHVSPAVREEAVNALTIAAPVILPVYSWVRARLGRKRAAITEDGAAGASTQE